MGKGNVDFSTKTETELRALSGTWEDEARIFEARLSSYVFKAGPNPSTAASEKIARLHNAGNMMWRRLAALERFRNRKKVKK